MKSTTGHPFQCESCLLCAVQMYCISHTGHLIASHTSACGRSLTLGWHWDFRKIPLWLGTVKESCLPLDIQEAEQEKRKRGAQSPDPPKSILFEILSNTSSLSTQKFQSCWIKTRQIKRYPGLKGLLWSWVVPREPGSRRCDHHVLTFQGVI